ncbi:glucose-6-phosphate isomerase [Desulfobacter hydrogenophilus]|uniref:Glucose-6-phosphate isomerase n=1 Tax=Desulfobacter hydrogenophilus TaxID=2291 RepID=A0A328FH09_9BACT|nr:glucose-6-phosphate isomerase [Desulfobacter hydrogenophilus]NDY73553.1 glucose-6-phosphate isomerase [Desulfobacter hydrogenophilus]QBH14358.1 glucose-6-phosphate isomerase [Desulfobacter hydrogenophilus]RAM02317.1 glucose-6-phosphate isomerase [Desulfobacter hydrogenophilus]
MSQTGLLYPDDSSIKHLHAKLTKAAQEINTPDHHLRRLLDRPGRFSDFSLGIDGFFMDFSRQRLDENALSLLHESQTLSNALKKFSEMTQGQIVNPTENRAALHTAARGTGPSPLLFKEMDVKAQMQQVNKKIEQFCLSVHEGKISSACGKPFTQAVVIGIGGSYLGCEFVYQALAGADRKMDLLFLPNVDIDNFARVIESIDKESTLWIVISKSYTTTETMANLNQVSTWLTNQGISPEDHMVTITAKGSPGDDPDTPVLASFHMFDFIGGRYSVSSAVGGLPLSLALGYDVFKRFLDGCRLMDTHVLESPAEKNIALTAALISIWNTLYMEYPAQAIIPYASRLARLSPHVQQLYMESLGKSVSPEGQPLTRPAGTIIFGEPGTNAQHSFFQLAHQGNAFPVDFIGIKAPGYTGIQALSKGVTNHQELWANLLAQAGALALGRSSDDPARNFDGNRPSTIITIDNLEPESVGMLLSFYEARTVLEGFILGVNPFDQFGVELGKVMAGDIRKEMAAKNQNPSYMFACASKTDNFYLDLLFRK